jgi:hypothetical protein
MGIRMRSVAVFAAGVLCSIAVPAVAAKSSKAIQPLQTVISVFMTRDDVQQMINEYDQQKVEPVRSNVTTVTTDIAVLQQQLAALEARIQILENDDEEDPIGWIGEDPPPYCSTDADCGEGYTCAVGLAECPAAPAMCAEGSEGCSDVIIDVQCVQAPGRCVSAM